MENFANSVKKMKQEHLVLMVLFILWLLLGLSSSSSSSSSIPEPIANVVDSLGGKIGLFVMVVYMFLNTPPALALLSLAVAVDLMRRSSRTTGIDALKQYAPSEKKKSSQFSAFNQFPYTLEQEVVKKMAPILQSGSSLSNASYKPLLENLYNASAL